MWVAGGSEGMEDIDRWISADTWRLTLERKMGQPITDLHDHDMLD